MCIRDRFVTVQQTLMLDLRIGGVHPDIMVLLPIVAGIVGGPARGASMGFGAGLVGPEGEDEITPSLAPEEEAVA